MPNCGKIQIETYQFMILSYFPSPFDSWPSVNPLSDPDYFGGGVGEHILDSDSALTMTRRAKSFVPRAIFTF